MNPAMVTGAWPDGAATDRRPVAAWARRTRRCSGAPRLASHPALVHSSRADEPAAMRDARRPSGRPTTQSTRASQEKKYGPKHEITERVARWIEEAMPSHVEAAGGPVIRQSCMCCMTPDSDFVIEFLGGEFGEDVVVGVGFSGHGFKMAPAVGRFLAEMAIDGKSNTAAEAGVELGHYRISRFDGNPMGNAAKDY
ncbi:hypothetical protein HU200_014006 [Digitaria exilis]|uniref:FAD dependent oxidoreductase domain-containing protein n=1 Tax=Digitaria exilis TaxID=1010633 RepID=A0A835KKJ6_9POAL|nr:hypothetical protein HU200_014006 [Digitaria exilis]